MSKRICSIALLSLLLISCQGQAKEELVQEGRALVSQGNHNGAIVLFKNALEKDQNYLEARQALAEAYMATGKYDKAVNEFLKVQLQNPADKAVALKLAELYTFTNQPERAVEEVRKYLQTSPETSKTHEILARAHLLKGDPQAAREAMNKAIALDADNLTARLTMAELMLRQGEFGEARSLLNEVLVKEPKQVKALGMLATLEQRAGQPERALDVLDRLIAANPGDPWAPYMAGFLRLSKGDVQKAEQLLAQMTEKWPTRAETLRLKGMIHFRKLEFENAANELQRSLTQANDPQTTYFLGLSYFQLGKFDLALNQFQKVLDYLPDYTAARYLSALTLYRQGRLDDADKETRKILQTQPNLAIAHNLLGDILMAKGDFDAATEEIDLAIKLDPGLVDAHMKKGVMSLMGGDQRLGEAEMVKAVDLQPQLITTRIALGSYYLKTGQLDKALETFKKGISGKNTDAVLLNNAAMVCLAKKDKDQALKYFQLAKEAKSDYFAPYFNLAAIHAAAGEYAKAEEEYRAVLAKQADNSRALLGLAQLSEVANRDDQALEYYQKLGAAGKVQGVLLLTQFHLRKKEPEKALQALNEGLKANPTEPALLEFKGQLLAGMKRFDEAVEVFQQVAAKNPVRGTSLLTSVYLQAGQTDKALMRAEELTRTQPREPAGYLILASAHEAAGNPAAARATLSRGLEMNKDNNQIRMEIGRLYEKNRQPDLALKVYDEILKGSPEFIPALFGKAALKQYTGKTAEAVAGYRKVLELDDSFVPALNNLAFLYADGAGSSDEAVRLAWRALQAAPNNASIMDTLGYALLKNGRAKEAVKVLEKAAKYLPDNAEVKRHLAEATRAAGQGAKVSESGKSASNSAGGTPRVVSAGN